MGRKNKIEKSSSKLFKRKLNEKKNSSTIDFNKRKIFRKGGNTAKTYFDNKNVSYDEVVNSVNVLWVGWLDEDILDNNTIKIK